MEKDTKYFIGVVIILLIAVFSSSLNLTGKSVSDITGMTISGATCTARSDTNYANPKSYNSDCGKAYDASTTSALIMGSNFQGWVSNAEIILNFASAKDIGKISILPYGALTNAKLYFNDETTSKDIGSVPQGQRSEFTVDKTSINKIKITWTFIGGYQSGIYDIGIIEGSTCNDPDGNDLDTKSCATGIYKRESSIISLPGQPADDTICSGTNCCDDCYSDRILKEAECYLGYYVTFRTYNVPVGYICKNGANVLGCNGDSECTVGKKCVNNVCVEETCSASNCGECDTKDLCLNQNPSLSTCSGKSEPQCTGDCEWIASPATAPTGGLGGEVVKDVTGNPIVAGPITTGVCRPKTKCIWSPPGTTSNPEGGCCPNGRKWNPDFYPGTTTPKGCGETAFDDICTFGVFKAFSSSSIESNTMFGKRGCSNPPCSKPWTDYCAGVGSQGYGMWYPIGKY